MADLKARLQARLFAQEQVEAVPEALPFVPVSSSDGPKVTMQDRLAYRLDDRLRQEDSHAYAEIRRVCQIPVIPKLEPEEVEDVARRWVLREAWAQGFRLWREQAEAILAWETWDSSFCPIGVGWGKTLITLMLAEHSLQNGHQRVMLVVPAQVYQQLVRRDIPWARRHIRFTAPITEIGSISATKRKARSVSKRRGLYVVPYSCLSTKDAEEVLLSIAPSVIILDEAHYLKNYRAARTRRVVDFIVDSEAKIAALSGTITSKGVRDYHHIIRRCLGARSPLPDSPIMAGEWGAVIDSNSAPTEGMTGPLRPLVDWARRNFRAEEISTGVAGFRKAYRLRLTSCPGVVASGDSEVSCSLVLANQPVVRPEARPGWDDMQAHIKKLEEEWVSPCGDEIEHAIHTFKWMYELSLGFYNELYWPSVEWICAYRGTSEDEARSRLLRSQEHFAALQEYHKELRDWLHDNARLRLDTPMLVALSMSKDGAKEVGDDLYRAWMKAKDLEFEEMLERQSRAIRVCDFKIHHAVEWAKTLGGKEGILWVYHQEVGEWAYEALRAAGIEAIHCPAGDIANKTIVDPAEVTGKICVASVSAHGIGKNLQHFSRQLFLQWPRPADRAEQALGRTHRNGQQEDEIVAWRCDSTVFDEMLFAACVQDSLYIHQTTGARQKLIYATYDPMPRMFSPEALRERGFQNKMLDSAQRKVLEERFG